MHRHILRAFGALAIALTFVPALGSPAQALTMTPDTTWMTNGTVFATAISGNTLFIGGRFTQVQEKYTASKGASFAASGLAAFDVTTGVAINTFSPDVTNSVGTAEVRSLAVSPDGATLYLGGTFDAVDGNARLNFAAVNTASGAVDATFDAAVGTTTSCVCALLASSTEVYLGGDFGTVDGTKRNKLAAIDTNGTLDSAWKPNANRRVRALAFAPDGSIFVGGLFDTLDGASRQSVGRVYADTGNLHPWAIPSGTIAGPQNAWDFAVTPTRLFVGFGKTPNYAAAFRLDNGDTGTQLWRFNTVGNVQTVALSPDGTQLFIGGHFGTARLQQSVCNNQPLHGLALLSAATGAVVCTWIPGLAPFGHNYQGTWSISVTNAYVWIGGGFTSVSGVGQRNVARFTI